MSDSPTRRGIFGRRSRRPSPEAFPPPPLPLAALDQFEVPPPAPPVSAPLNEDDWYELVDLPFSFALAARNTPPPVEVMVEMERRYQVRFPSSNKVDLAPILRDSPRLRPLLDGLREGDRIARDLTHLSPDESPEPHLAHLATALEDLDDIATQRRYFGRGDFGSRDLDQLLRSYGVVRGAGIHGHDNLDMARAVLAAEEGPELDIVALYDDCHLPGAPLRTADPGTDERRLPPALLLAAIDGHLAPRDLASASRRAEAKADSLSREMDRMVRETDKARERRLGSDTAGVYDHLLTASREEALLLGVSGHSPEANFQRYAVANLLLEEQNRRNDRAYEDAHWMQEPDVAEPFGLRLLVAAGGNVAVATASTEFPHMVAKNLGATPTYEMALVDEDLVEEVRVDPTPEQVIEASQETLRLREMFSPDGQRVPQTAPAAPTLIERVQRLDADAPTRPAPTPFQTLPPTDAHPTQHL